MGMDRSFPFLLCLVVWVAALGACSDNPNNNTESVENPVLIAFDVEPAEILAGQRTTLSWTLENASAVTISNAQGVIEQVFEGDQALEGSWEVSPTATMTFQLDAINVGPSGQRSAVLSETVTVVVRQPPMRPTLELSLSPQTIVRGQRAVLSWVTTGAESITVEADGQGVEVDPEALPDGQVEVSPQEDTTYRVTVTGAGEQISEEISLAVQPQPRVIVFGASADTVNEGDPIILSWQTEGATRVEISDGSAPLMVSGKDPLGDSIEVNPVQTTTYTLTAQNAVGDDTAEVTVTVRPSAAVLSFVAEPALVARGLPVVLSFTTEHATTVELYADDRAVPTGPVNVESDSVEVRPEASVTYKLVAIGDGGRDEAMVEVDVVQPVVIEFFDAEPALLNLGEASMLRWAVEGADEVALVDEQDNALDIDPNALEGEFAVAPTRTTTYRLIASGIGGMTSQEVTVEVDDSVRVSLTLDPEVIDEGGEATLSWQTIAANRIELTAQPGPAPDIANLSPQADILTVSPEETTVYTLTAFGEGGQATDEVTLQVNPAVRLLGFEADTVEVLAGQPVTLSWETQNAARVTISDGQQDTEVETTGTLLTEPLFANATFTIRAEGVGGPLEQSIDVGLLPAAITSFEASALQTSRDEPVGLSWALEGAAEVALFERAHGQEQERELDVANVGLDGGSLEVNPARTTHYRLVASSDGGQQEARLTVEVPLAVLELSPVEDDVLLGQDALVTWRVQGADRVEIQIGEQDAVEDVPDEDGRGSVVVRSVSQNTPVVLTAFDDVNEALTSLETVVRLRAAEVLEFGASPQELGIGGAARLSWVTQGADQLTARALIEGLAPVDVELPDQLDVDAGAITVPVPVTTTFELTASNNSGEDSATARVVVPVEVLELRTEPEVIPIGGQAEVFVRVQGALSVLLDLGQGRTAPIALDDRGEGSFSLRGVFEGQVLEVVAAGPEDEASLTLPLQLFTPNVEIVDLSTIPERFGPGEPFQLCWTLLGASSAALEQYIDQELFFSASLNNDELFEGCLQVPEGIQGPEVWRLVADGFDDVGVSRDLRIEPFGRVEASLRLSEVFYDGPGGDDGQEWVELYNAGPLAVSLGDAVLGYGGGSFAAEVAVLPQLTVPPGGCVVVGGPTSDEGNGLPVFDAEVDFEPDLQNSGVDADGVALFAVTEGQPLDDLGAPFDGVIYGDAVNDNHAFLDPFGQRRLVPDVVDAPSGQSIARSFAFEQEEVGGDWGVLAAPTPGRCFGLALDGDRRQGDPQLFEGRRQGPESGGVTIGLKTFNTDNGDTEVFFGPRPAQCEVVFGLGLSCLVPEGAGLVDLIVRQGQSEVVYPDFYAYASIDFCNVQFPDEIDVGAGEPFEVYGRVFEDGVTQAPGGSERLRAQWGYGPVDTDPLLVPELWIWVDAQFNVQNGNDDEYVARTSIDTPGSFAYAYRFTDLQSPTAPTYCDVDGTVNNNVEFENFFELDALGLISVGDR